MALWLAVWEIVCRTAGPAGMYACGARTIPKSSLLVSAGHSVSPSGVHVWSAVSSPGIPLALAVGSGQRTIQSAGGCGVAAHQCVRRARRRAAPHLLLPTRLLQRHVAAPRSVAGLGTPPPLWLSPRPRLPPPAPHAAHGVGG